MSELADLIATYRLPTGTPAESTSLALAVGDEAACRLVAAFAFLPMPDWKRPRGRRPKDLRERWLWIWEGYVGGPDEPLFLTELARRAGVRQRVARAVWPAIVSSRLVFPDGSISEDAKTLINAFVFDRLPKPKEPSNPRPPAPRTLGPWGDR